MEQSIFKQNMNVSRDLEKAHLQKKLSLFSLPWFLEEILEKSKYPVSYLTSGLKEIGKWLWLARFLKLDSKFHFIHANDIAQICGFLIKNHKEEQYKGFRKFVLGQKFISIDHAIITLLKRNNMRRYFAIPLQKNSKNIIKNSSHPNYPWDSFSIKKYDFNHVPITNPETFKLKSYAKSLNDILRLSKLPSCNNN